MANLNCTTQQRLAGRGRHQRFWRIVHPIAARLARIRFNFAFDDLSAVKPPYLLLCNHATDLDPVFVGVAMKRQGYFVATENVLHAGLASTLLMRYFCPIIHQKGRMGLRSAKEILQTLAQGASVALFPEGSRTFNGVTCPIAPVTAKLARKAGALVCVRLEGGYLTQPRWSTTLRRGRLRLRLANVYNAAALAELSDAELQAAIEADLFEDAFARQRDIAAAEGAPVRFAGKRLALGMESALFACPDCGGLGTLASDDEHIRCTAPTCGFSTRFTPEGFFEGGRFDTLREWDAWQGAQLEHIMACADGSPLFSDAVTLQRFDDDHNPVTTEQGTLQAFADHAAFTPDAAPQSKPLRVEPSDIAGLALFSRNTLIVHAGNPAAHYEIRGNRQFNALKYVYALEIAQR